MYLYWTRTDSHTGTYSTKGSVCVDSQRKEVTGTESIAASFTDVHMCTSVNDVAMDQCYLLITHIHCTECV